MSLNKFSVSAMMVVKNEERWIWYAIQSVLDYVDELYIYDTGSTDNTLAIIDSINSPKIIFKKHDGAVMDAKMHTEIRNNILSRLKGDWILIVDGDELWPEDALIEMQETILTDGNNWEFLIRPFKNLLGDVYHFQEESAGRYQVGPYSGHITTRAINRSLIPGMYIANSYPLEAFFDSKGTKVPERNPFRGKLMKYPFLHATHLRRSSTVQEEKKVIMRLKKYKYELGNKFPDDYIYPKSFYMSHPVIVPSPWERRSLSFTLMALWLSPLRFLKRRILG